MKRKWFLIPALAVLSGGLALAQFGGVFTDPVQSAHALLQIEKAVQKIKIAVKHYEVAMRQLQTDTMTLQMAIATAKAFGSRTAWKGYTLSVWRPLSPNIYGETHGWDNSVGYGFDPVNAWKRVSVAVHPKLPAVPGTPDPNLATVDIADGTSVTAMQTIAESRKSQTANAMALRRYEITVMDTSKKTNSQIQQLNLANAGIALQNRQSQNQNALLTTVAEQQLIANKVQRDRMAEEINIQATQDHYIATAPVSWGGTARALSSY